MQDEVKLPPTPAQIGKLNSSLKVANPSELSVNILPGADIEVGSLVSFRVYSGWRGPNPGGSSSVGRASAFQAECREFEPRLPLHIPPDTS